MLSASIVLVLSTAARLATAYDFSWAPKTRAAPPAAAWTQYFQQAGAGATFSSSDIQKCSGNATNVWGASFDDGPSENTHVVLDYFQTVNMKTTFWVIGLQVLDYPDVLVNTTKANHQIGLHTWSHPDLTTLSQDQVVAELVYSAKAVYDVTGLVPRFFRPPYGAINDNVRKAAAMMGLRAVTWAKDSADWSYVGKNQMNKVPQAFQSWVDSGVQQAISLEHDLFQETVSVVKQSMDILLKAGRVIKPLSECIGEADGYNNPILSGFFKAGQFENRDKIVPVWTGSGGSVATSGGATKPTAASGSPSSIQSITNSFVSATASTYKASVASGVAVITTTVTAAIGNAKALSDSSQSNSPMPIGMIVGASVGAAVLILIVAVVIYCIRRKQLKREEYSKVPLTSEVSVQNLDYQAV
ncbi:hypothetical protein BC830DRAFT_1157346 [Chytriomyces sp. MP71]|nr:hypothetical protein BC830DRAFT_1157346 [Chytriomyces sp. MP71]